MPGASSAARGSAGLRRWLGGPPAVTVDLTYDAFVVRGSAAQRAVLGWIGAVGATVVGLGIVACALLVPASAGTRAGEVALGGGCLLVGQALLHWAVPALVQDAMLTASIVALGALGALGGTLQPLVPMVFVVLGTSFFMIRSLRFSLAHLALMGASYAAVVLLGPETGAPGARFVSVLGAVLVSGLFLRWLVARVTEVARSERAARDDADVATAELLRTTTTKDAFLARMSRELRTPADLLLGRSEALRLGDAGPLTSRQRSCIDDIAASGRALLGLIDDLLDAATEHRSPAELVPTIDGIRRAPAPPADLTHAARWFSNASAALLTALAVITPGSVALRGGIFVGALIAVAVGWLVGHARPTLTDGQAGLLGAFSIAAISVGAVLAGPYADLAPLAYGWIILASAALLSTAQVWRRVIATLVAYSVVVLVDRPDMGTQLLVAVSVLVASQALNVRWLSARFHDLMVDGHRRRLDAEATWARAQAASAHKSDFLARTSHDLRAPLDSIIGFARVLDGGLAGPLTRRQAEHVADILETGHQLRALITDLLDLARLETGRLPRVRQRVALAAVVQSVVQEQAAAARRRHIELVADIDDDLPDVEGDPTHLRQVLDKLVANGIKFTLDGGRVEVRGHVGDSGGQVLLSVRDAGIGISPEHRNDVFEAFHQGMAPLPGQTSGGTGLGLALVKGLVEIEGGTISLESTPSIGSTFTVALPALGPSASEAVLA